MRWFYVLPVFLFFGLIGIFGASLVRSANTPPDMLPSALIGKRAPQTLLPALDGKTEAFSPKDLASGHVTVVNVWASWCVPCRAEAPALMTLSAMKGVSLYGLVYKDTPAKARGFLNEVGDPYRRIDLDTDGRAGIEWGIYGVPETFVIDGKGIVRLRYPGPLVGSALSQIVLPAIEKARQES
ncbi:MAG TPA: DsbE family thiol:disulfide interchange protein [Rhizomicrobium sp.]|nr:DsbE family thiol:disulfide interchange protein [Rhizomicrobium sp.]